MISWRRIYAEVDAKASRSDRAEPMARAALLAGMILSICLLVPGLVIAYLGHESDLNQPPTLKAMLRGITQFHGVSLLYLGLLALAFTPFLRVCMMLGVYIRRREWLMVLISSIVLFFLILGFVLGTG